MTISARLAAVMRNLAWRLHRAADGRVPVDDLMQEGAIAAHDVMARPGVGDADRERYAYVESRSAMIDALRRERRHQCVALDDGHEMAGPDNTESVAILRQRARIVAEEMQRLPEAQRDVLSQLLDGREPGEIASDRGVSVSAVSHIAKRAENSLRRSVGLRTRDAELLRSGTPVRSAFGTPVESMFDPSIVGGVTPALIR